MKLVPIGEDLQLKSEFASFPGILRPEQILQILTLKFPVEAEAFLIQCEGRICGRILLQTSSLSQTLGHFSLFYLESSAEPFLEDIWSKCEEWLKMRRVSEVTGPYLFSTYFPYRYRSDLDSKTYSWEPAPSRRELELLKKLGFEIDQTYFSNFIEEYGIFASKGEKELSLAKAEGIVHRPISSETLEKDVEIIYKLSMEGFTDNHLFAPIPLPLFKSLYLPSFQHVDLRLSCIQENSRGEPIGFNFTFFDGEQIVIKSVCVLPLYRGKGLLNAGIRYSMLQAFKHYPDVKRVATALIHEGNGPSRHVANQSQELQRHEYVLLKKAIT
jgi:hypothetical protein